MCDWVRLCSIVELFDYRTSNVQLRSIGKIQSSDWVRLPNVRLTTSGVLCSIAVKKAVN